MGEKRGADNSSKEEANKAVVEKRGRGRPRNDPNDTEKRVAPVKPKRGPGRPPKAKGRGRPKKDPEDADD